MYINKKYHYKELFLFCVIDLFILNEDLNHKYNKIY